MAIPAILKGETSKPITLSLAEGYDYAGCSLHVDFCRTRSTFVDLGAGGSLELRFTAEQTAGFPLGTSKAMLSLENAAGEIRFMPWAKIKVTDSPADLYDAAIVIDPASLNVDDLTTGDSLGVVKTKLQAVINFLRGLKVLAVCAIPFFALADVAPLYTTPNEMPGDAPIMTNTAACISAAVTNLDARPVAMPLSSSGRGVTFVDSYGENQNVAIEIGEGARAAVTTNALESAADNKVVRSTGVAIGGHAEVRNDADPLKIQGVAVGWHAQVSAINGVAIGSGAVHPGDNDATVASAAKALAIGYGAKASAADAVQLGEGENTEAGTLKYRNVTVVKDGKVAANPAITNALARHEAEIDAIKTDYAQLYFDESNGVKRVTIQNDAATFRVVTDTNRADGVALTMGDAEIYGTAAIDRKLADKADVARLSPPTGTTADAWICDWSGEILPCRIATGPTFVWQKEYNNTPALIYVRSMGRWQLNTQGSSLLTVTAADTASALDFSNDYTLTRKYADTVAYKGDIPPAVSNVVTKTYVEGLGISADFSTNNTELVDTIAAAETDPTISAWAKAAQKPSYTADEVGAASSNKVEEVRQDNAQTRQIVMMWESFLDGSNVVFAITNYISGAYSLDAAKLRIQELRDGVYREVYNSRDEILLHINDFSNRCFRVALDAIVDEVAARLASKADKDWGKYTSAGGEAPSNTVYMTAPNTVFAGGLECERVAVGEGSICVLTTRGAPVWTQGDEGTFKFQDDGGTNYFGFAKTDSYTIGANTDGITVQGGMVTMQYNITMSGRPCVWYKSTLSPSVEWEQLNLPDGSPVPGASHAVTWEQNPDPGTQVCYINVGTSPQGFFRATVEVAGDAKFMTNMPADLSGGIISTNTAAGVNGVVRPTFNGSSVIWNWSVK